MIATSKINQLQHRPAPKAPAHSGGYVPSSMRKASPCHGGAKRSLDPKDHFMGMAKRRCPLERLLAATGSSTNAFVHDPANRHGPPHPSPFAGPRHHRGRPGRPVMVPYPSSMFDEFANQLKMQRPRFEVCEDDDEFQLSIDVPGVKSTDMSIQLEQRGQILRIKGTRNTERKTSNGKVSRSSTFERAFRLDSCIDTSKMKAKLEDGVLKIDAPKVHNEDDVRRIPIMDLKEESRDTAVQGEVEINTLSFGTIGSEEVIDVDS